MEEERKDEVFLKVKITYYKETSIFNYKKYFSQIKKKFINNIYLFLYSIDYFYKLFKIFYEKNPK